jgi:acetoin utilization deacetylase AcuC-like enzyme
MEKYSLLPEQLVYEGTLKDSQFFTPEFLSDESVLRTHGNNYWQKLKALNLSRLEERRTGFPLSANLIQRELAIMSGTVEAAKFALKYGVSMNIAGGTHHAFTNRGEGFCLLNDLAIAARELLWAGLVSKVLIVDLDVHQGNGTAQIFRKEPAVFTFSMHGASNYPAQKEKSDLDIALPDRTGDTEYLNLLDFHLKQLIQITEPEIILYQSGVDVLASDKLGRLNLSIEGCRKRDKLVLEQAHLNKIPLVAAMGGGYSSDIKEIIEAHANTFRLAMEIFY